MLDELLMRFGCVLWRDRSLNSHPLFSSSHCLFAYHLRRKFAWGLFVGRRDERDLCRASVAANAQIGPFIRRLSLLSQHSSEPPAPPPPAQPPGCKGILWVLWVTASAITSTPRMTRFRWRKQNRDFEISRTVRHRYSKAACNPVNNGQM